MPAQARIGDIGIGICCCHSHPPCIPMVGLIVTGSATTNIEGSNASRITDIVVGACGHIGILFTSSSNINIEGLNSVRVGDHFTGCFTGIIVTGAMSTQSGG